MAQFKDTIIDGMLVVNGENIDDKFENVDNRINAVNTRCDGLSASIGDMSNAAGPIYFAPSDLRTGSYGRTIRIGYSSMGGYNGDTYYLSIGSDGSLAVGTQLNGASYPTWHVK